MPDKFRTNKQLFREFVMKNGADVPEATRNGTDSVSFLDSTAARGFLATELDTHEARSILGNDITEYTIRNISPDSNTSQNTQKSNISFDSLKRMVDQHLPTSIIELGLEHTPLTRPAPSLSHTKLAARLYTAQSMIRKLEGDVQRL
jgi:hypothetical protein